MFDFLPCCMSRCMLCLYQFFIFVFVFFCFFLTVIIRWIIRPGEVKTDRCLYCAYSDTAICHRTGGGTLTFGLMLEYWDLVTASIVPLPASL